MPRTDQENRASTGHLGRQRPPTPARRTTAVRIRAVLAVVLSGAGISWSGACHKRRSESPRQAIRAWNRAISDTDCDALYDALDEKSKWAVMSMAKDVTAAAELIRKKYEGQARMRELSKLGTPLVTEDPRRLFVASCRAEHLVEELARRYGRLRLDKVEDGRATAISEKGAPLSLVRDKYGRWGVPVLRERLERRAVRAANVLKALRGDTFGGARP